MNKQDVGMTGLRVGIFGKGGAGKSTCLVLLARALQERGYQVCVLDADSTNFGLARALGVSRVPDALIEYFGGMVFSGGAVTCPVDDPTRLSHNEISLGDLPERYYARNEEGVVYMAAGKLSDKGPGAGCDGPIVKIARDLKVHPGSEPNITLVDFKAGFEDTARGAVINLDWALVVVDPTTASINMAGHMRDIIEQIKNGGVPATAHIDDPSLVETANAMYRNARIKDALFVLSRIPNQETESFMKDRLKEKGLRPVGVFYEDRVIADAWMRGAPFVSGGDAAARIVREIEKAELEKESTKAL